MLRRRQFKRHYAEIGSIGLFQACLLSTVWNLCIACAGQPSSPEMDTEDILFTFLPLQVAVMEMLS